MVQRRVSRLWRRIGAAYGVVFVAATAAASHHHLNGIEDLFSDGPSDSGLILAGDLFQDGGAPRIEHVQIFDDDSCLACFPHDFVAAASRLFVLCSPSTSLVRIGAAPRSEAPQAGDQPRASRSPPVGS